MEVVRLVDSVLAKVEKVRNMIKDDKKLRWDLMNGLEFIKFNMALLCAKVKKISAEENTEKPEQWVLLLQDLAYEIEDFIDLRKRDGQTSAPVRLLHIAMVTDPRPEHIARIRHFKDLIQKIQIYCHEGPPAPTTQQGEDHSAFSTPAAGTPVSPGPSTSSTHVPEHLGIGKSDLLELLREADGDGHQNQLKVISILGCSGSGKTTLARAVYDDPSVIQQFPDYRAFVYATHCNQAYSILHSILRQVHAGESLTQTTSSDIKQLTKDLQDFLRDKRYIIIIDDVQLRGVWSDIEAAFPNNDKGSRVVVSTSIQSVATACSSGSYLYRMPRLDGKDSVRLFWQRIRRKDRSPVLDHGLQTLIDKCDGLPLALVQSAEFLNHHQAGPLTEKLCQDVGVALGTHLAGDDPAFQEIKRRLVQCYGSLADHGQKTCMLSVSIFPKGHRINRKSLIRRWKAEGLVTGNVHITEHEVARDCLDKLADLGIIEPVVFGNNSKAKRYQVHGVMLEFIVHRSVSWNFMTLIHDDRFVHNHASQCAPRRISVHGAIGTALDNQDLQRIRSLTICNSSDKMDFGVCKLLRVLDLEGCSWADNAVVEFICGLLHLKYLSLRRTPVSEIPKVIKDLHCLETLDLRQTGVEMLPMEVLMLPQLAHLFGEFELPNELAKAKRRKKIKEFFSQKSRLQTLAGFKIVKNQGFEQILLHARLLSKVKIWCKVPPPPAPSTSSKLARIIARITTGKKKDVPSFAKCFDSLVSSLQTRFTGQFGLDSLSVDFDGHRTDFLGYVLNAPSTLSSIKLQGEMASLPDNSTLSKLRNLRELHLSNTGLLCGVLSGLQSLDYLVCLKLAETCPDFWIGSFHVQANGFPSLQRLCFDAPNLPDVHIEPEAMRSLVSLQLICPEPENDLGVRGIEYLQNLNEVILHPDASEPKLDAWKTAAIMHQNRPYIIKKQPNNCKEA